MSGLTRSTSKREETYMEDTTSRPTESGIDKASHLDAEFTADDRIAVTDADDRRILRKTDLYVLPVLLWIYFLQILDKSVIGYSAVYGLKTNAHLVGNQYSTISSIGYYAQLGAQPLGAYLLVKIPVRPFISVIVFCWGAALCGMSGSTNYHSLLASKFLLGFFESACLPLFTLITASWYRRSEQPLRVAAWYSTNGAATMIGSALVYALAHVKSNVLHSYQIIFLVCGIVTVITGACLWFVVDNSVAEARFLNKEDRLKAVERLRSNNTGIVATKFKPHHLRELALDPKTWLFMAMAFLVNVGASVSNTFGPLILQGLAGFTAYKTTLLNIPFGALQVIVILGGSYAATKFSVKSYVFAGFMLPVVIGAALLYAIPHEKHNTGPLLVGYYFLAFLFAANPLIVSWMTANTAGQSKKTALFSAYNAFSAAGNVVGPNLFKAKDAPAYIPGLKSVLAIFCVLIGVIAFQVLYLTFANKRKESARVAAGRPAKIHDLSMARHFHNTDAGDAGLGNDAFLDLTDKENLEFVYLL